MTFPKQESGSSLVEALVVAPTFAIVLGAALAVHSMYAAKLTAEERARRLAWLQADSGDCPESSSPECDGLVQSIQAGVDRTEVDAGGLSLESFLQEVRHFFVGKTTRGVASAESRVPDIIRKGATVQYGGTELLCNSRERQTSDGGSVLDQACRTGLQRTEYAREVCH
jgi:hypothetical protein